MPPKSKNLLEIYQLLDKSNCRQCGEKSCLAFARAVFLNQKKLQDCPVLPEKLVAEMAGELAVHQPFEPGLEYLENLKSAIVHLDLAAAADRTGGAFAGETLTLKVLGKDFRIDVRGNLSADIHINPWIAIPLLNYVLYGEGLPVTNTWVSLRELQDGRERYPLFQRQCEEPMKRVADGYPELFDDIVRLFSGRQVDRHLNSDISVVLHPLPKIPIMICYWLPDEGLESSLNVFFDETADRNLDTDSVFTLGVGLAYMFKKIARRHGFAG